MDRMKDLLSSKALRASIKHWVTWDDKKEMWIYYPAKTDEVKKIMKARRQGFMGPFETREEAVEVAYLYNIAENDTDNYPMIR